MRVRACVRVRAHVRAFSCRRRLVYMSVSFNVTLDPVIRRAFLSNVHACLFCTTQVFQRRYNGSVDFYRVWADYKSGFGSASGEFWLGNDNIHSLTSGGSNVLRIDMETFGGETAHAEYDGFSVDDESTNYVLRLLSYLPSSNAGKLN